MMSLWEHVDRLDDFESESIFDQKFDVSFHCDRVAGDVEQFEVMLSLEICEEFDCVGM